MRALTRHRTPAHYAIVAVVGAVVVATIVAVATGAATGASRQRAEQSAPPELRVSAATSLKGVLESCAPGFERATGTRLVFNFGPSGQLQQQIEAGAPVDVFCSASPTQVDALVARGRAAAETTVTFAGNDLVVFVATGAPLQIERPEDLARAASMVTGDPKSAPHGSKAREWLEGLGLWGRLEPRFVFAANSAQTVDYVARKEVEAGIGFASEVRAGDGVEVAYLVPKGEIEPIRYVAVIVGDTAHRSEAKAFEEYLLSEDVQRSLASAGFKRAGGE